MSELGPVGRPSSPGEGQPAGGAPPPPPPVAAPSGPATGQPPPPPPQPPPSAARRRLEEGGIKVIIAVMIGLVSVTGALITWRSSTFGEKATNRDRRAIAETVLQQQQAVEAELLFSSERTRAADYLAHQRAAAVLTAAADAAAASDRAELAEELRLRAGTRLAQAAQLTAAGISPLGFVGYLDGDELDEDQMRADLRLLVSSEDAVFPDESAREAERLRDESVDLFAFLVPLVFAVALLTIAEIVRARAALLALTAAAIVVWIAASVLAFGAWNP